MALTQVKTLGIADDAVTGAKIADDAINSEHYVDGSIDNAHVADDQINSEHYAAASIDHEHLADDAVDGDIIADNAVGLAHMAGGTDGVIITYDASGNPVHVGPGNDGQVLTSTGAGSPPAFEDATGGIASLVADTSPQLGGDLDTNSFEISLDDNHKVKFGDGTDLSIYHSSSTGDSYIEGAGADIVIRTTTGHFVELKTNDETAVKCNANSSVEIFHDNAKVIETIPNGMKLLAGEDGQATLELWADEGDDNNDKWRWTVLNHAGGCNLQSYEDGTWENRLAVGSEDNGAVSCCFVTANDISDGGISFGNANIGTKFYAVSDTTNSIQMFYNSNGVVGTIKTVGSATQFNTSSDYRLKENEVPLENAITKLKGLKPYTFNFKNKPSEKVDGFYAHEAQSVVPIAVTGTKDEMAPTYYKEGDTIPSGKKVGDWTGQYSDTEINPQGVDYGKFTPLLTKALQEAIAKIETLETKVAALEAG